MDENRALQTVPLSLDQRLRATAGTMLTRVRAMPPQQKTWLGISLGCALLTMAGILWYAMRPDWRTLFAGLDPQDAREMADRKSVV